MEFRPNCLRTGRLRDDCIIMEPINPGRDESNRNDSINEGIEDNNSSNSAHPQGSLPLSGRRNDTRNPSRRSRRRRHNSEPSDILGISMGQIRKVVNMRRCIQKNIKKSKLNRKKPKDAPRRPLSAYNYFFKDERVRIIAEDLPGTVGFHNMTKTIGTRWKALSEEERASYKERASVDKIRYRNEMDEYNAKKATGTTAVRETFQNTTITTASKKKRAKQSKRRKS